MNYGEKLYQGMPEKMAEDKKVVDVYLGEGTSAKFEKLTAKKKLKDVPLADVDIDKEINDPWSFKNKRHEICSSISIDHDSLLGEYSCA